MAALEQAPRAGRREWIGLAVIALPCLLYSMDLTVLNLAVPAICADLKPSATELLWIVDIYGFSVAGLLITMGTLGDRIGGASCCSVAPLPSESHRSSPRFPTARRC
jgi:MFS transporter, DHA2 family, multidrug resistance protein